MAFKPSISFLKGIKSVTLALKFEKLEMGFTEFP